MRALFVVVGMSLLGCTEVNRSTLQPFVRDMRAAVGGVEMIQCEVVVTTTRERNWFNNHNKTTREISTGGCWNQVVPTEPPAGEGQGLQ
jgi:hypothetical protein